MKKFSIGQSYYIPRSLGIIPLSRLDGKIFVDKCVCESINTSGTKPFIESQNRSTIGSRCFESLVDVKNYAYQLRELEVKKIEGQIAQLQSQIEILNRLDFIVVDALKEK